MIVKCFIIDLTDNKKTNKNKTNMKLTNPITVTTQALVQKTFSEIVIQRIADLQGQECVKAFLQGFNSPLILWDKNSTPTYSDINNWTQEQAEARILELLS